MAKWQEMAADNLLAAKSLQKAERFRSAVSRAYYAAYCLCTGDLEPTYGQQFTRAGNNPSHDQLLMLVAHNLRAKTWADIRRRKVKKYLHHLRMLRIAADYVPPHSIDEGTARRAITLAVGVFEELDSR